MHLEPKKLSQGMSLSISRTRRPSTAVGGRVFLATARWTWVGGRVMRFFLYSGDVLSISGSDDGGCFRSALGQPGRRECRRECFAYPLPAWRAPVQPASMRVRSVHEGWFPTFLFWRASAEFSKTLFVSCDPCLRQTTTLEGIYSSYTGTPNHGYA